MLRKLKMDMLKARKEKDVLGVSVLGYLISEVQNKEIALRGKAEEFTDEHIEEVINSQIKRRKESIEQYSDAGRTDLSEKEESELAVLEGIAGEFEE